MYVLYINYLVNNLYDVYDVNIIFLFYVRRCTDLLVNISFISVVPEQSINTTDTDETIAATFFRQLFGGSEVMVRIFTALVVLSVVGTAASTVWR